MDWYFPVLFAFLLGALAMGLYAERVTTPTDLWHEQAIKHGCAEYYLDSKHQAQWRWKN